MNNNPHNQGNSKKDQDQQQSRASVGGDNAADGEHGGEGKALSWGWSKESRRRMRSNGNSKKSRSRRDSSKESRRNGGENIAHRRNNNNEYDDEENFKDEPLLADLLEHLRAFLAEGMNADTAIDVQKARNVLEASAGNIPLSAQLYWDDYFATQANDHHHNHHHDSNNSNNSNNNNKSHNNSNNSNNNSSDSNPDGEEDEGMEVQEQEQDQSRGTRRYNGNDNDEDRRVRRRLENDFERMQNAPAARSNDNRRNEQEQQEQQDAAADVHVVFVAAQAVADFAAQRDRDNNGGAAAAARAAESVSVSDDDSGGAAGLKRVSKIVAQAEEDDNSPFSGCQPKDSKGASKKQRKDSSGKKCESNSSGADDNNDVDDGYFSDNDWIWARNLSSLRPPMELLWGNSRVNAPSSSGADSESGGYVIADDDEADEDSAASRLGIPTTWLHAGFSPDSCGNADGIQIKAPKEEDVSLYSWRQNNSDSRETSIPRPYHCRSITALLSVVTALLYTGASIKTNEISCSSPRKPYAELTPGEKKREFEWRLADALSALLFIAAKASVERKKRALASRKSGWKRDRQRQENPQKLERKLGLCPTCWWEEDAATGEARLPDGRDSGQNLQIAHSLTNIKDLRAYVLSNMRSFTSPGGCALFLETILSIHGKGAVASMIRYVRRQNRLPAHEHSLIACTCEERQRKLLKEKPHPPRSRNITTLDTSPPGHSCISTELLSLLITGRVHSTFYGWSAGPLGFGILSHKHGEVGKALSRPDKPVWVLRGETCYSVVWLDGQNTDRDAATFSKKDHPGYVARMTHWNCWFGQRNKSGLQLTCARSAWAPPRLSKPLSSDASSGPRRVVDTLRERCRQRVNVVDANEDERDQVNTESQVMEEEMTRVKMHPDDVVFYPNKYRLWRFDMGEDPHETGDDRKRRGEHWVPYHCLKSRQKLVVEMKLGPKINRILWTRWPEATIDNFTPEGGPPPIV